jgi:hypothetical protein
VLLQHVVILVQLLLLLLLVRYKLVTMICAGRYGRARFPAARGWRADPSLLLLLLPPPLLLLLSVTII